MKEVKRVRVYQTDIFGESREKLLYDVLVTRYGVIDKTRKQQKRVRRKK